MKFKNKTGKAIKYRIGDISSGYVWKTIRENEVVDISRDFGKKLGLTPKNESTKKATKGTSRLFKKKAQKKPAKKFPSKSLFKNKRTR